MTLKELGTVLEISVERTRTNYEDERQGLTSGWSCHIPEGRIFDPTDQHFLRHAIGFGKTEKQARHNLAQWLRGSVLSVEDCGIFTIPQTLTA